MAISKELLEILACPKCKGDVHLTAGAGRSRVQRVQAALPDQGRHPGDADRRGRAGRSRSSSRARARARARARMRLIGRTRVSGGDCESDSLSFGHGHGQGHGHGWSLIRFRPLVPCPASPPASPPPATAACACSSATGTPDGRAARSAGRRTTCRRRAPCSAAAAGSAPSSCAPISPSCCARIRRGGLARRLTRAHYLRRPAAAVSRAARQRGPARGRRADARGAGRRGALGCAAAATRRAGHPRGAGRDQPLALPANGGRRRARAGLRRRRRRHPPPARRRRHPPRPQPAELSRPPHGRPAARRWIIDLDRLRFARVTAAHPPRRLRAHLPLDPQARSRIGGDHAGLRRGIPIGGRWVRNPARACARAARERTHPHAARRGLPGWAWASAPVESALPGNSPAG